MVSVSFRYWCARRLVYCACAAMAGMRVVVVACDEKGYIDLADLEAKAKKLFDRAA